MEMMDFSNWRAGVIDLDATNEDGDDLFPCATIHVDDHANAIQCWGISEDEATARRDAVMAAIGVNDRLLTALKLAKSHLDYTLDGEEFRQVLGKIDAALAAAGAAP